MGEKGKNIEQEFSFLSQQKLIDEEDDSNFLSDLDFIKFLIVAKRNLLYVLLIIFCCLICAYLYIRYTNPSYQSTAVLKLEISSKADLIGINTTENNAYNIGDLSGEIELIKSSLVLGQVADIAKINVSYYAKGNILNEERYKSSPFVITNYEIDHESAYNKNIYIEIIDGLHYKLSYDRGDKQFAGSFIFGKTAFTPDFKIILDLTSGFDESILLNTYFFKINTRAAQLSYLATNLAVEILNADANTLKIAFTDNNAIKAKDIVKMIDSVYMLEGMANKYRSSEQTIKYLQTQLKENEENMEKYEREIQAFIIKNKSTDLKSDVVKNIIEVEKIDKELLLLKLKLQKLNEIFDIVTSESSIEDLVIPPNELDIKQINDLVIRYNDLRKQREILLVSNRENTLIVKLNAQEMTTLKKQSVKIISEIKKSIYQQIAQLNATKTKLEDLIYSATPKDNDFKKIQRMYAFYERIYLMAFDKKIEFEMLKASTVPNFRVLSPPVQSRSPIYPVPATVFAYAASIGIVLSFILVVIQYFLHNTLDNVGELERGTIAPVLGYVPRYEKAKMQHSMLVIDKSPKGPITESLRTIRTNIEFLLPNKSKRLISVTSTISGEGKTFVSLNLAGVIAFSGQKVVILDLDMRKPKIHLAFEDDNERGVSTILINRHTWQQCLKPTSIPSLSYIPSGPIPPNPSELIIHKEFDQLLVDLAKEFDTIIIDSPPVGLVTDGVLIMKKVDLPIYVIRAEYSKKGFEKNINRLITKNGFHKLSVILNDFGNLSGYGYGYKYGYGYGYGYYENAEVKTPVQRIRKFLRKI